MKRFFSPLSMRSSVLPWLAAISSIAGPIESHLPARADWPLVRGDAAATGVAATPLVAPLEELWTFRAETGGFAATAAIVDGVVYVGDDGGTFYALELATGKPRWTSKPTGEAKLTEDKPLWTAHSSTTAGFIAGTAVVDGRVYCVDFNGAVRCLDARDGSLVWQLATDSALYAAPNCDGGAVLLVTDSGELLALDAASGEARWRFAIDQPLRCWPTVVNGQVLVAGCDKIMHRVDVQTGKAVGQLDIGEPADAMPAVRDGRVFFCTAGGVFQAMSIDPFQSLWKVPHAGQGEQIHAAAVSRDAVVFGTHRKEVLALDPASGEKIWEFSLKSRAESSPIIAGSLAVFATTRGRLHAVDVASGEERWEHNVGGRFTASPAVSQGRLVIGNEDGALYCFGNRTESP